jgi:hypothetical protein
VKTKLCMYTCDWRICMYGTKDKNWIQMKTADN